jgi:activator of 2-hydroxyglutaryl-CoA dehydratase
VLGGRFVNEVIALTVGLQSLAPDTRTAIEIGGQDSKLLLFEQGNGPGSPPSLRDFSANSLCAAGTGSFLDQQAGRLGVAIEREFGELALRSQAPPQIAGRCSVFAKSDMIHLQQIATPVHDIAAGLCLALARSFKSTVGKGKKFERPVCFLGGVASNAGMIAAFENVLGLEKGELRIPPHHRTLGAIGAAISVLRKDDSKALPDLDDLEMRLLASSKENVRSQPCLRPFLCESGTPSSAVTPPPGETLTRAWIGIDVGSVSTNVVAIDEENHVLSKRYLWTASRPIEAVRTGLDAIRDEIGDRIDVCGVGTTGSGRYLIGEMVGADVIRNEITAQATAAMHLDAQVDTIFEIGGQDSKYVSIEG